VIESLLLELREIQMRRALLLATLLLAGPRPAAAAPAGADGMSEDERVYCASERGVLEKRRKVFEGQNLPAAEIARRNEPQLRALRECRDRFQAEGRRALEQKQDLDEVTRRAGPNATELERERTWREVRRERLASKNPSSLSAEEKAELAAGTGDELRETHRALDDAHQRDPQFMRVIYSAIACYHGDRRADLKEAIASEERMVKLGTGERQKLYTLRSELRQSEEVLSRNDEAVRSLPNGLERCTNPTVAVVAHCMGNRLSGARPEAACESEEIQQYVRFVK
jgi:hypothetical protein